MTPLRLRFRRSIAPTALPVTLDEAKAQPNVDFDDDNDLITRFIKTATAHLDGKSGQLFKCICPQTWVMTIDGGFPCAGQGFYDNTDRFNELQWWQPEQTEARVVLPLGPVLTVSSVAYVDTTGTTQTLSPSAYDLVPGSGLDDAYLVPKFNTAWPQTQFQGQAATITYTAGYATDDPDFDRLRSAILLHVSHMYENRGILAGSGSSPELIMGYSALIDPFIPVKL